MSSKWSARIGAWSAGAALLAATVITGPTAQAADPPVSWPSAGHDVANTRSNPDEHGIGPGNVAALAQKWSATLGGEMASTPAVVGDTVYAADLGQSTSGVFTKGSTIWALNAASGATRWSRTIDAITGGSMEHTRGTPAVADGRVVFGTRKTGPGARIIALDSTTGATLWTTQVDSHRNSIITGAPTITGGVVYIGVSSSEDAAPTCCTFRGSVVALDAGTGQVKWRTLTAPVGYSGASVWASNPAVDAALGMVYVGTGNNYSVPAGVCRTPTQTGCTAPDPTDYVDTLLALRLSDGKVAWSLKSMNADVWRAMCKTDTSLTCGPDSDFGSSPNLFTAVIGGVTRKLVGAGQKGGLYWAADAATGAVVWQRRVGPGGLGGGIQWGTATDGSRIYAADANSDSKANKLPNGTTITTGSFAALDVNTGAMTWQLATPNGAQPHSFVSTANGVVYVGTDLPASGANMYALDAGSGKVLWSYAAGGRVRGGASIVGSTVYWGGGSTLRAFALPASAARPDLVVTAVGTAPATPTTGAATRFTATVKNVGTASTPAGTVAGVLFKVDGVSTAFSDTHTASIAPGASVTLTTNGGTAQGPGGVWTATAGAHTILATVDDLNRIPESNDANNTRSVPLTVGAAKPDLVVTAIGSSPAAPAPGTGTRFTATIKNAGTVATPAGTIAGVRFRVDGVSTSFSDTQTAAIAPGASVTLTANGGTAQGPGGVWTATAGSHTIQAEVDDLNRIAEANETNNTLTSTLTVVGKPDLVVTASRRVAGGARRRDRHPLHGNGEEPGDVGDPGGDGGRGAVQGRRRFDLVLRHPHGRDRPRRQRHPDHERRHRPGARRRLDRDRRSPHHSGQRRRPQPDPRVQRCEQHPLDPADRPVASAEVEARLHGHDSSSQPYAEGITYRAVADEPPAQALGLDTEQPSTGR